MKIDAGRTRKNVQRLADYAKTHGIGIRPHTKTHKSLRAARIQLDAGAIGLTVAKTGEAAVMSQVCDDVLMAYPAVDPPRCEALAKMNRSTTVRVAIDSTTAADHLSDAATVGGSTIGILVDIDIGLHRTGVQTPETLVALAQYVESKSNLRLDGIFCYPGHISGDEATQKKMIQKSNAITDAAIALFDAQGLNRQIVSGGSTPTAYYSHCFSGVTEIRSGTYVYNDMNGVLGDYCELDDCAARIHCTVVSDAVPGKVVLDAGSKTLTSDKYAPRPEAGHGHIIEYPNAVIKHLTEEHGEVDITQSDASPKVGERVTVIPIHICVAVNMQNHIWWDEGDGQLEKIPVDTRGMLS